MYMTPRKYDKSRPSATAAFTLVELLAVIVIIAILTAMVLGMGQLAGRKAYVARTVAQIEHLHNALLEYKLEEGIYPPESADLGAALGQWLPADFTVVDAWDQEIVYRYNSVKSADSYILYSKGPDTNALTADDITSGG